MLGKIVKTKKIEHELQLMPMKQNCVHVNNSNNVNNNNLCIDNDNTLNQAADSIDNL